MSTAVKKKLSGRSPVYDRDSRDRLLQVVALVQYRIKEIGDDDHGFSLFGRGSSRELALLRTIDEIANGD